MSGLSPIKDRIIEVAAIRVENGIISDRYTTLVNPNVQIREHIAAITGIHDEMLQEAPTIETVMPELLDFIGNDILLGHSVGFDFGFLMQSCYDLGIEEVFSKEWYGIDTLAIARKYMDKHIEKNLDKLCGYYGIEEKEHHRALNDAEVTKRLYETLCELYENDDEFKPIQLSYKPKKQTMIPAKQIRFLQRLVQYHGLDLKTDFSKLTQREGSRLADSIIRKYGKISH